MGDGRSKVLLAIAIALAVIGAICARIVVAGEGEIALSTAALEAGDAREAVVRARRAAGWYVPGAPHVRVAYERLTALAEAAESHGHDELAKLAWRSVRSASTETTWIVTPHAAARARADREIARLEAKVSGQRDPDPTLEAAALQKLSTQAPLQRLWAFALIGGFALAAIGFSLWSRQASAAGGKVRGGRLGLALAVAGAFLWLLAVWRG